MPAKGITIAVTHVEYREGGLVIGSSTGDDEIVEPLDPCFDERIVARVGVAIPPSRVDRMRDELNSDPSAAVAGMPWRLLGFSISDAVSGESRVFEPRTIGQDNWTTLDIPGR